MLGEQSGAGGTTRTVDSSLERGQVVVSGMRPDRYAVTCNGYPLPLAPDARPMGEAVAGVRFRAWKPVEGFHPHDPAARAADVRHRSIPGPGAPRRLPVSRHASGGTHLPGPARQRAGGGGRRLARFERMGHAAGSAEPKTGGVHPDFPLTLDLRRVG